MPGGLRDIAGKTLVFIISFLCCFPGPGKLKSGQGKYIGCVILCDVCAEKTKRQIMFPRTLLAVGFLFIALGLVKWGLAHHSRGIKNKWHQNWCHIIHFTLTLIPSPHFYQEFCRLRKVILLSNVLNQTGR